MARMIPRKQYRAERAAQELRELLENPAYAQNAAAIGQRVRAEQGHLTACDEIERILKAF